MTKEAEKQAVDDAPQPGVESKGSEDSESLDSLLSEFETGNQAKPQPDKSEPAKPQPDLARTSHSDLARTLRGMKPLIDYVQDEMDHKADETVKKEVGEAISFLKEANELKEVKDIVVRGLMEALASEDKEFATAFKERQSNPNAWKQALSKGRDWVVEQIKDLPGSQVRNDLEAAQAAVAGQVDETPDESGPSVAEKIVMTSSEWRKYLATQAMGADA